MRLWAFFACAALLTCPPRAAQPAQNAAAARLDDLAIVQRDYVDVAPSFSPQARRAAHALIARLRSRAASMSEAQFALALMQIPALADNAHDAAHLGHGAWRPALRLPVRMIWFPDALIIARAAPEHAELLGASVVAVEGLSPPALLARMRSMQGGTGAYRRWQSSWIFHSSEALHALGIAPKPDRVAMRLRLRDGRVVERLLSARAPDAMPPARQALRYWMPALWTGEEEKGWRAAANASHAPLYLQQPDEWFRMVELPALEALYVQFRSNMDEGETRIAPFVAAVTERLRNAPPTNAIVDLRFDTGGDNTQNRDLMRQLAHDVPGRIYVLVGPYTFSAGIASAAALVHDGREKVTIVGSDVGDRTHWWSEHARSLCLPASHVCFGINSGYWDIVDGCQGQAACYSDQFDLRVRTLAPALPAPLRSTDWLLNRDPAMEAARADLAGRAQSASTPGPRSQRSPSASTSAGS